jgi:hypothetical protein
LQAVTARSPSMEKGDLDASIQPMQSRDKAGSPSEKCDLRSRLWSIIDIHEAGYASWSAVTPRAVSALDGRGDKTCPMVLR